jgi:hypothetical protein
MMYRFWWRRAEWSSPGVLASAILGVGALIVGIALLVDGGKPPDGWETADAVVVDDNRTRRARLAPGSQDIRFRTESGELVETRCGFCDTNEGDTISIAYDPEDPERVEHPGTAHSYGVAGVLVGGALTSYAGWKVFGTSRPDPWVRRRWLRRRQRLLELSVASSGPRPGRSRGRRRP